jgi:hypothetical protein
MNVGEVTGLAGISTLVSLAVDLLKKNNVIPDGYGGVAAALGDITVFALATLGQVYNVDIQTWDDVASQLVVIVGMVGTSFVTHKLGRNMEITKRRESEKSEA